MRAVLFIVLVGACATEAPLLVGPELLIDVEVERSLRGARTPYTERGP